MIRRMIARVIGARTRRLATLLALLGAVMLAAAAPRALRNLDATRVRRVEVYGARLLAPQEALATSGITRASSMFDDADVWRRALLEHPLVRDVRVRRRLPATVVLHVAEVEPVALVRTPELRPVDEQGRVLPIDPWAAEVDAPVIRGRTAVSPDGVVLDADVLRMIAALATLRREDRALVSRVSEAQALGGSGVRLVLRGGGREALLAAGDAESVRHLRAILDDLRARGELARVTRIDTRFRDQVVVAFAASAGS